MAMRYLVRRDNPEDLSEVRSRVPDLERQLGKAAENFRRDVEFPVSAIRSLHFTLLTLKKGNEWIWACPSIELEAENEAGLFALAELIKAPKPSHLITRIRG